MPIAINGSGTITGISAGGVPDASINTEDLNAGTASSGQKLVAAGASGAMTWGSSIVLGTPQNSTSGTAIDFTGIPSWVRRITVMFNGVSTNGTSPVHVQLGTGATPTYTTSGYLGSSLVVAADGSSARTSYTSGFLVALDSAAAFVRHGNITITNVTGNVWTQVGLLAQSDSNRTHYSGGSVSLAALLTAVRITTVNGTDTFDAGSINIQFE